MKCFNFYWSWYEDYKPIWLTHEDDKTEEQFQSDCIEALKRSFAEYIAQEKSWIGFPDWQDCAVKELEKIGYAIPEIVSFGHFGSYIIGHDGEDDEKLRSLVGNEIFDSVIAHNKEIKNRTYGKETK